MSMEFREIVLHSLEGCIYISNVVPWKSAFGAESHLPEDNVHNESCAMK